MVRKYTGVAIALHWLVALGIVVNVGLAWVWPYLADDHVRPVIDLHKSVGITVLGLAIMRLLWRATHRPPALPTRYQRWEVTVSHVTHWLLYAIIFAMPLSGWIMDSAWKDAATHPMYLYGLVQWPRIAFGSIDPATRETLHTVFGAAHAWLAYILYALVGLHVAGALKHEWIDGHRELRRIVPGAGRD
ncbi:MULTISPECIES: cytochrome b [unclassified Sphingomonas]|uniref:cytochrome b n=1 Tax=unclassified Sphingomonas TaxID=196159 RepID=UPI0006FD91F8|nr:MULTISPECIES: cytochrome b [unclassified Sphingomonas]KQS51391.1 cytochrome B [Sphingomonas sp. Leaf198]